MGNNEIMPIRNFVSLFAFTCPVAVLIVYFLSVWFSHCFSFIDSQTPTASIIPLKTTKDRISTLPTTPFWEYPITISTSRASSSPCSRNKSRRKRTGSTTGTLVALNRISGWSLRLLSGPRDAFEMSRRGILSESSLSWFRRKILINFCIFSSFFCLLIVVTWIVLYHLTHLVIPHPHFHPSIYLFVFSFVLVAHLFSPHRMTRRLK